MTGSNRHAATYHPDLDGALRHGNAALSRAMADRQSLFMSKDCIALAGRPEERIYRLRTGCLCRSRHLPDGNRQILLIFLPGDLVGVTSLLYAGRPDDIECLTDATVNWIDRAQLRALVTSQGDVALFVMWHLAEQERRLQNMLTGLGRCDANERLAGMLLDFHRRLQRLNLASANCYRLPMTQRDIADYLGLTVVHVSRVLARFRKEGVASIVSRVVTLHDAAALARIATPMLDWCERRAIEAELYERVVPDLYNVGGKLA
jgi:CRP/FNR family transcriptional regulator